MLKLTKIRYYYSKNCARTGFLVLWYNGKKFLGPRKKIWATLTCATQTVNLVLKIPAAQKIPIWLPFQFLRYKQHCDLVADLANSFKLRCGIS
jgi:hypothetical protein